MLRELRAGRVRVLQNLREDRNMIRNRKDSITREKLILLVKELIKVIPYQEVM